MGKFSLLVLLVGLVLGSQSATLESGGSSGSADSGSAALAASGGAGADTPSSSSDEKNHTHTHGGFVCWLVVVN